MILTETEDFNFVKAPHSKEHIDTKLPSYHMLEGEYKSFLLGRSEDYEDLREYQIGDSVRDIDWRATARMNEPVIRRFRQEKKHDIIFLIDSGKNMLGATLEYKTKQSLGMQTAGTLMNIALQHQDTIKVVYAKNQKPISLTPTTSQSTLNSVLNDINKEEYESRNNESTMPILLNFAAQTIKRASIVVVVSDSSSVIPSEKDLSIVGQRNHILWLSVNDQPIANNDTSKMYADIQTLASFPDQIRTDPKIIAALAASVEEQNVKVSNILATVRSNHAAIDREEEIIPVLYDLLHESSQERA